MQEMLDNGVETPPKNLPILRERLSRYLDPTHPSYDSEDRHADNIFFDLPDLLPYVEEFFSSNFLDSVMVKHLESSEMPRTLPDIHLSDPYKTFSSAACPHSRTTDNIKRSRNPLHNRHHIPSKPVRMTEVYPLTMDQTEIGLLFIQRNDDYLFAINAIKQSIKAYIEGVRVLLEDELSFVVSNKTYDYAYKESLSASHSAIYHGYHSLEGNAKSFVFTHDLAVEIAAELATQEKPFTTESITEGIRSLFRIQAFQSANETLGNSARDYKVCPYKNAIIDMLRIGLEKQNDGSIKATRTNQHGKLIFDVRNIVRERYFQAWSPPGQTGFTKHLYWRDGNRHSV